MTEITRAAREMAADLANAENLGNATFVPANFSPANGASPSDVALARLCARFIAMQEDMERIVTIAARHDWLNATTLSVRDVGRIAAKHRAEVDPLVDALSGIVPCISTNGVETPAESVARQLRGVFGDAFGKAKP